MPTEREKRGGIEMNKKTLLFLFACFLMVGANIAFACEYVAGETKFLDYAHCRYGEDSIEAIQLPEDATWEVCIYYLEAFRPPKLLAVTKQQDGKEMLSVSNRSQIGNPCYLTKQLCDAVLKDSGL